MAGTRLCASCNTTPLSVYNPGVLCAVCEPAAFSAQDEARNGVPAWIWGTAPMRRMLAALKLGPAMETFRVAARMSQAQVAELTGWSPTVIGLIETEKRGTIYNIRNLLRVVDAFEVPREMLLPVILGNPAAFGDRRLARSESWPVASREWPAGEYRPGEIMHIISGKLKARGFDVTERVSGDEVTEITVTSPEDRGKGSVSVGSDGYVTWEWMADLTGRCGPDQVTERITELLGSGRRPEKGLGLVRGGMS